MQSGQTFLVKIYFLLIFLFSYKPTALWKNRIVVFFTNLQNLVHPATYTTTYTTYTPCYRPSPPHVEGEGGGSGYTRFNNL